MLEILNDFELVGYAPQKINCWDFVGCGRELGGENVAGSGVCMTSIDTSADGANNGKNGGWICWAISGTFCGGRIDGSYAKKILSCRSCEFFHKVREEEGSVFISVKKDVSHSIAEAAECI